MIVYEVRTAADARIGEIKPDRKSAVRFAQDARHTFPGCYVVEIDRPEPVVRRIWTDRLRLVAA